MPLLRLSTSKLRRRAEDESGQVIVLLVLAIVAIIAMCAFSIDVGYAYYGKRQLQAAVDASALAGAQDLPNGTTAQLTAMNYSASTGGQNALAAVLQNVNTTVTIGCRTDTPNCVSSNSIIVNAGADVATHFAKFFGLNSWHVSATARACGPCGGKPADVMVVLDRTGSMCQDSNGNNDPNCTDINNAVAGIKTLLGAFDPNQQHVGLAVFPPSGEGLVCTKFKKGVCTQWSGNDYNKCSVSAGTNYGYDLAASNYLLVPLSSDYQNANRSLNTSSDLVSTVNCQQATGVTSYAKALEAAQAQLTANGRPNTDKVILLFSDGAANAGNGYLSSTSPYRTQPCHQGVTSAGTAKAGGTIIYAVAYDVNGVGGGSTSCKNSVSGGNESPAITGTSALQQIASGSSRFYVTANSGNVQAIFNQIAAQIIHGASLTPDS